MNKMICSAISTRSVVNFDYDGGSRIVEPHCHGTSTAGKELLRGFQTAGASESGESYGWKLFDVAKISDLTILDQIFTSNRPNYNPNDSAMQVVCCHV